MDLKGQIIKIMAFLTLFTQGSMRRLADVWPYMALLGALLIASAALIGLSEKIKSQGVCLLFSTAIFLFFTSLFLLPIAYSWLQIVLLIYLTSMALVGLGLIGIKIELVKPSDYERFYIEKVLLLTFAIQIVILLGIVTYITFTQGYAQLVVAGGEKYLAYIFNMLLSLFIALVISYPAYKKLIRPLEYPKFVALPCAILIGMLTAMVIYGVSTYFRLYETVFLAFGMLPIIILIVLLGLIAYSMIKG